MDGLDRPPPRCPAHCNTIWNVWLGERASRRQGSHSLSPSRQYERLLGRHASPRGQALHLQGRQQAPAGRRRAGPPRRRRVWRRQVRRTDWCGPAPALACVLLHGGTHQQRFLSMLGMPRAMLPSPRLQAPPRAPTATAGPPQGRRPPHHPGAEPAGRGPAPLPGAAWPAGRRRAAARRRPGGRPRRHAAAHAGAPGARARPSPQRLLLPPAVCCRLRSPCCHLSTARPAPPRRTSGRRRGSWMRGAPRRPTRA